MSPAQLTVLSICHGIKRAQYFGCGNIGGGGVVYLPIRTLGCETSRPVAMLLLSSSAKEKLTHHLPVLALCLMH
jgi:hypothetical protein